MTLSELLEIHPSPWRIKSEYYEDRIVDANNMIVSLDDLVEAINTPGYTAWLPIATERSE